MFSGTDCKGDDGDNHANDDNGDIGDNDDNDYIDDNDDDDDIGDDEMASVQWLAPDKSAPDWN